MASTYKPIKVGEVHEHETYLKWKWNKPYDGNGKWGEPQKYRRFYDYSDESRGRRNEVNNPYNLGSDDSYYYSRGFVGRIILESKRNVKGGQAATYDYLILSAAEIIDADDMQDNADSYTRQIQAALLKQAGYRGPLAGGTAKGLANAFAAIGMPDLVKRGYCSWEKEGEYVGWDGTKHKTSRPMFTYCYQFKSPRPDIEVKDFVRLVKACKKNSAKFAKAVNHVINDPNAADLLGSLDVLDVLGDIR